MPFTEFMKENSSARAIQAINISAYLPVRWFHVDKLTVAMNLTYFLGAPPEGIHIVKFEGSLEQFKKYHWTNPNCTQWSEVNPNFTRQWHLTEWIDAGASVTPDGKLSCGDMIEMIDKETGVYTLFIVNSISTDMWVSPKLPPPKPIEPDIYPIPRDVAITAVNASKTVVGQGYSMSINITIENQGYFNEIGLCFADLDWDGDYDILWNVTLAPREIKTITFIWNTGVVSKGNYTIIVYAKPVPYETDTADNTFFDGWVYVGIPCDISGPILGVPDGVCNMRDIGYICSKFGTTPSSPNWDPNADVTGPTPKMPDNIVNMRDVGEACRNFGKADP